jgi:hypothetical protein
MTQPKIDHFEAVRPDSITLTTVDGVSCYAFNVRDGDIQPWDVNNIGPSGKANQRAEISFAPAPGGLKYTSPYNVTDKAGKKTYDVDYRFKAGFPLDQRWAVLTQFHPQDDNPSGFHGFGGVTIHGKEITLDNPSGDGGYFGYIPIQTDKWVRLRIAVNWSSKADGYAKVVSRATGAVIGLYKGPTIAAGEFKYVKQGYYRDGGITAEGTVYETLMDISEGDLTEAVTPPAPSPPSSGVDIARASAGLKALLDTRRQLEAAIPQIDEEIDALLAQATTLQTRRNELQTSRDQIASVLDKGPWGGGIVAT